MKSTKLLKHNATRIIIALFTAALLAGCYTTNQIIVKKDEFTGETVAKLTLEVATNPNNALTMGEKQTILLTKTINGDKESGTIMLSINYEDNTKAENARKSFNGSIMIDGKIYKLKIKEAATAQREGVVYSQHKAQVHEGYGYNPVGTVNYTTSESYTYFVTEVILEIDRTAMESLQTAKEIKYRFEANNNVNIYIASKYQIGLINKFYLTTDIN